MTNKFDPSKPVQTRGGGVARIVCRDARGKYPIVALIDAGAEWEAAARFTSGGWIDCDKRSDESVEDLINIPETHEMTVHFYRGSTNGGVYASRGPIAGEIASKRITFTEGEFED